MQTGGENWWDKITSTALFSPHGNKPTSAKRQLSPRFELGTFALQVQCNYHCAKRAHNRFFDFLNLKVKSVKFFKKKLNRSAT
jgi:hypothetical protein